MTAPMKLRRVDFYPGDWLGGTAALSLAERGLYITACMMIYEAGGPVPKAALRQVAGVRLETFNSVLLKLVDKGKLELRDGMIDQARCEREIARAFQRIADKTQKRTENVRKNSVFRAPDMNETKDLTPPLARAEVYQATKEEDKILEGGRGVAALPVAEPAPPPEPEPAASSANPPTPPTPPTPEQIAEVDALVSQATAALRGGVPKGIRDAVAYGAVVKANKFTALVKNLNAWAGVALGGEARMSAWEVLAAAERAGARSGMTRPERRNFDRLAGMYRATGPPDEMERQAA